MVNDDLKKLYRKFLEIKKIGFIKTMRNGPTGIGYTFEELINKPEDNFPIPDFNLIEIKTYRFKSRRTIHLFSAAPDGDFLFPIKRIVDLLGYPDKSLENSKIFNLSFNGNEFSNIGYYKKGKIIVNYEKEKIDFVVYNNKNKPINVAISWSFELLKERLNLKLKYLALISTDSKFINNEEYFHYNYIRFLKLKDFSTFIKLIEQGYINICFNIGVFKNGKRKNQIHDRGTNFTINVKDINKLYDSVIL